MWQIATEKNKVQFLSITHSIKRIEINWIPSKLQIIILMNIYVSQNHILNKIHRKNFIFGRIAILLAVIKQSLNDQMVLNSTIQTLFSKVWHKSQQFHFQYSSLHRRSFLYRFIFLLKMCSFLFAQKPI